MPLGGILNSVAARKSRLRTAVGTTVLFVLALTLAPGPSPAQIVSQDRKEADDALLSQRIEDAIVAYRKVVRHDPNDAEAWLRLGLCLHNSARYSEALPAFEKSLELKYARMVCQYNIGCALAMLGQTDKAFEALNKAVDMGYNASQQMSGDPDLVALHSDPRYTQLINRASRPTDFIESARRLDALFGLWNASGAGGATGTLTGNTGSKGFARQIELLVGQERVLALFLVFSAPENGWTVSGADRSGGIYEGPAKSTNGRLVCEGKRKDGGSYVPVKIDLTYQGLGSANLRMAEKRGAAWVETASYRLEKTALAGGLGGGR